MSIAESAYAAPTGSDAGAPVYAVYNAPEELLARLADPVPSAEAVHEYLRGECEALLLDYTRTGSTVSPPPIENFFHPDDLNIYADAMAWWPRIEGMPVQFAAPSIYQLIWRYHDHTFGSTFIERLTARATAAQAWLIAEGHNAAQPNASESPSERRKRLAAARQKRHRERQGNGSGAEAASAVADAYRRWQDLCRQRKDAHAAVDATWGPLVHAARVEWDALRKTGPASGELGS
jgi:hypothetical protein